MKYSRQAVVDKITSWLGWGIANERQKKIVDIYNSQKSFPRGVKMEYDWAWCACTYSSVVISLGYQKIMPVEISCIQLVKLAKQMGIWVENDGHVPSPGDAILYDWEDSDKGDNTGSPDHIGIVTEVYPSAGYFVVIEGNYKKKVSKRTVCINGKYIRGFICPKFDDNEVKEPYDRLIDIMDTAHKVISGRYGNGDERVKKLKELGYSSEEVEDIQFAVNRILMGEAVIIYPASSEDKYKPTVFTPCNYKNIDTSLKGVYKAKANLNVRIDAGTNKKIMAVVSRETNVKCNGEFNVDDRGVKWLLIQVESEYERYIGFSSSNYLTKIS